MAPIREEITNKIRDELVAGRHEAGAPLREIEMANRFGVSRGPVRDAFLQLSQEGFLEYHTNRGVTVRHRPSLEDQDFVVSLRSQIELYVVSKGFDRLTPEGIGEIEAAINAFKVACDAGEVVEVAKTDMAFHKAILMQCGGEEHRPVWTQLCGRMLLAYSRQESYEPSYLEHEAIFHAIRDRDLKQTLERLDRNISCGTFRPDAAIANQPD